MGQVNQASNLLDRVVKLERGLEAIRKMAGLTSAIISRGGLSLLNDSFIKMVDDLGTQTVYIGPDDQGRQIVELRRENGSLILRTFYTGLGGQAWALYDNGGRVVCSDDGDTGIGMAQPWIPVPMYARAFPSTFLDSTGTSLTLPVSSCNGGVVWDGKIGRTSHPWFQLHMVCGRVTGVSGNPTYTLKINNDTIDSWNQTGHQELSHGPYDITPYLLGGFLSYPVQITVSATGTGTDRIAAQITSAWMRQT